MPVDHVHAVQQCGRGGWPRPRKGMLLAMCDEHKKVVQRPAVRITGRLVHEVRDVRSKRTQGLVGACAALRPCHIEPNAQCRPKRLLLRKRADLVRYHNLGVWNAVCHIQQRVEKRRQQVRKVHEVRAEDVRRTEILQDALCCVLIAPC